MRHLLALTLLSMSMNTLADTASPFYQDKERGWFWHETKPTPEELELEEIQKTKPAQAAESSEPSSEKVVLDLKWLKANIDDIRDTAINSPTYENLAAFAYAQRLMLDFGTRFSTKMSEFMALETVLDESSRRPTSAFALTSFSNETQSGINNVMDKINNDNHIWFFYKSDCSYCMKQIPVLQELRSRYGVTILAISMDGGLLPGMDGFEVVQDPDGGVSRSFNVVATPTLFLANNDGERFIPLTQGMHSLPDLEKRILLISREAGYITNEEYALAKEVREINVFKNGNGEIVADGKRLKDDPAYLAELLKSQLNDENKFGSSNRQSTPINSGTK